LSEQLPPLLLNYANIIALPLPLGVGVCSTHFVMNWRAGQTGAWLGYCPGYPVLGANDGDGIWLASLVAASRDGEHGCAAAD
jgi:hypothetical protein